MSKNVFFYSFLASLKNEIGHNYTYMQSVIKAVSSNGWKSQVFVPKNCEIKNLPDFWQKSLAKVFHAGQSTNRQRLSLVIRNFFPVLKILKTLKKEHIIQPNIKQILFLEHFGFLELPLLLLTFLLARPKIELWLFYRFSKEDFGKKIVFFKFFQILLKTVLGKEKIRLFTDSEIIASKLTKYFEQKVKTMPIPHTGFASLNALEKKDFWWWPGSLIREEKGLKEISILSDLLAKNKSHYQLYVSEKAKGFLKNSAKTVFLKGFLSLLEYQKIMSDAKMVLLPYKKENYLSRTSGIFVEAVVAGALPVVTEGTWMAYELQKFDLNELVCDWERKDLIDYLTYVSSDQKIGKKCLNMRRAYQKYHSIEGYAKALKD